MPRPRKPARLYLRPDDGQWIIRDGDRQHRTGYGAEQRREAEAALAAYLARRELPARRGPAHPAEVTVGEVLARYVDEKGPAMKSRETLIGSVEALARFWGNLTCDTIRRTSCAAYARHRSEPRQIEYAGKRGNRWTRTVRAASGTVRRELGVLQAALNHAHEDGRLTYPIKVELPPPGEAREDWLTRQAAARLLRAASPHVRRFILISLYTGRRAKAVLDLTWARVDLDAGVIRFRADGESETNKRRGRVRIARQLAGHLRRWKAERDRLPEAARAKATHVVMFRGSRQESIRHGIEAAATRAKVKATPHMLKHSAITWAIMNGLEVEDAAEFFDTTPATIRKHYWHASPHHQERGLAAVERRK